MLTSLFPLLSVVVPLLAGLAALPVLIHLINMMRHRRVKWAAMDFLLASYKKHRNWVWLKQLLLLLMRVAAMLFAVMMLVGLGCQFEPLANLLGGKATHHYVLLDDSYSMSDRLGGASAFDNARQAVSRIAARAGLADTPQKFTLIRYSKAQGGADPESLNSQMDQMADLNAAIIDKDFDVLLEEKRRAFDVSQLAVGPTAALGVVKQLVRQAVDERPIVYMVSDFRAKEWDNPAEIRQALKELQEAQADVQLIGCMRTEQSNLAITDLAPTEDTRAAGVPLFLNVTVKNYGAEAAKKVQIKLRSYFFDDKLAATAEPGKLDGVPDDLPTVLIDEIRPGESVARRFQVYFPAAGKHVVEANLPEDPVASDNQRTAVIEFPEGEPVLVIDGDKDQRNAYYLNSAFQPGRVTTGIRPDVQDADFLRDTSHESLSKYTAIYLLDVGKLEARAVANLEEYVRGGGGLGIFVGDNFNIKMSNELLYKEGAGLFPLPLERADLLPAELDENTPDIEVVDHPMFKVFLGERNPLIRSVTIEQFIRPEKGWSPPENSTVQIIARLRNRLPLVVERQFGEGRVVAFLTSISTEWNNWSNDPSFVVVALKLQSHLAAVKKVDVTHLVGVPLEVDLAADKYTKEVLFITPGDKPETRIPIDKQAVRVAEKSPVMVASLGKIDAGASDETNRSGLYEAWPIKTDGQAEVRRYAVNVDPSEGDLALTTPTQLDAKLAAVKFKFTPWDEYVADLVAQPDIKWSYWLLYALIALLVGEQLLAYSASYHPLRGGARA